MRKIFLSLLISMAYCSIFFSGAVKAVDLHEFEFGGEYVNEDTQEVEQWTLRYVFDLDAIPEGGSGPPPVANLVVGEPVPSTQQSFYPIEEWYVTAGSASFSYVDFEVDAIGSVILISNFTNLDSYEVDIAYFGDGPSDDIWQIHLLVIDGTAELVDDTNLFAGGVISSTPSETYSTAILEVNPATLFTQGPDDGHLELPLLTHMSESVQPTPRILDHLDISTIPDVQTNQPILVEVTARLDNGAIDTGLNGTVVLSTLPDVQISPTQLTMVNGSATDSVTFMGGADPMTLSAQIGGIAGVSNSFTVNNPAATPSSVTFNVFVNDTLLDNGQTSTVHLIDKNGIELTGTASGSVDSKITFTGIKAGLYEVWAELDQNTKIHSSRSGMRFIPETKHSTFVVDMVDTSRSPVLVVPGMMGSTTGDPTAFYPRLPASFAEDAELKIFRGPSDFMGLNRLVISLFNANYAMYQAPWDWRMTIDDSSGEQTAWEKYLMDKIDDAKDPNKDGLPDFDKVDVVAHSLGGLLTRAYIQSEHYRNDIDKFVMLGTPNEGSTKAYYLVHGGDPVTTGWVYTKATEHLMSHEGRDLYQHVSSNFNDSISYTVLAQKAIRDFYRRNIPTGRQLLPTYPFLNKPGGAGTVALSEEPNDFLVRLNNDLATQTVMVHPDADISATPDKVRTILFVSNEEDTDGELSVNLPAVFALNPQQEGIYPEGAPSAAAVQVAGDETVTVDSAGNNSNACISGGGDQTSCWAAVEVYPLGIHVQMFRNFADHVVDYLNNGRDGGQP